MKLFSVLLLFLIVNFQLQAQNIYTDRPTQTTSSAVVPLGAFQIETGFQLLEFSNSGLQVGDNKLQQFSLNNTLLRYGISDRVELRFFQDITKDRLVVDGAVSFSNQALFAPTLIGAKFNLVKDNPNMPDIGLITSFGGGVFEDIGGGLISDIRLAADASLSDKISLSSNLGLSSSDGFGDNTPFYTLILGYGVDDKLGVFFETYGSFPGEGSSVHAMDVGLTYLLSPSMQVDFYGGTGISNNSANLLLGFGLSKRFLKQ